MHPRGSFPFQGEVVWLSPEDGGRRQGPPAGEADYAQVAHVLPGSAGAGTASFVLRGFEPGQLRSRAEGRWLVVDNNGPYRVEAGSVVVLCEGPQVVALFTVDQVDTI